MTIASKIRATGLFRGERLTASWEAELGFIPTGNLELDKELMRKDIEGVAVGGTYYPKFGTPERAVAVFCEVFEEPPTFQMNGEIPQMPYENGEDAIY